MITENTVSVNLEFLILSGNKEKRIFNFRKIWVFDHKFAPNYSPIKKCHIKGLGIIAKNLFSAISEFSV